MRQAELEEIIEGTACEAFTKAIKWSKYTMLWIY